MIKLKDIRKFFGVPSKQERLLLEEGKQRFIEIAKSEATISNEADKRSMERYGASCSLCGNKTIVNKIKRIQGDGNWRHFDIDSNEVYHCNNCGNQWKKFKLSTRTYKDVIESFVWALHIDSDGAYFKKVFNLLKDIPAESVYQVYAEVNHSWDNFLSISMLRKYFPSIYK